MEKIKVYGDLKKLENAMLYTINGRYIKIVLTEQSKGGLKSFVDLESGFDFAASPGGPQPLYNLTMSKKGEPPVVLTSKDALSYKVEQYSDSGVEVIALEYSNHAAGNASSTNFDIAVNCRVSLEPDSKISRWQISVKNNTEYGIRAIHFPVVVVPPDPGGTGKDTRCIFGRLGGMYIDSPYDNQQLSLRYQYPGVVSFQMQLYYNDTAGLYMATYDDKGCVKHFGITKVEGGLDLSIEHNYSESSGEHFTLPYDTILGFFHGDWYEAADIYKTWAQKQHWCSRKLAERKDIPVWLKQGRPFLAFVQVGRQDFIWTNGLLMSSEIPDAKFYPARRIPPLMREYASVLDTPVTVIWLAWEKGGCGASPDAFPPVCGEAGFKTAILEMEKDGNHTQCLLTGIHWVYKKKSTGYDSWDLFLKEGVKGAALDESGQVKHGVWTWRIFAHLCVGSEYVKDMLIKFLLKLIDYGVPSIQYDLFHGGGAEVCYSEEHGHPPGYGSWMYRNALDFLRKSRAEGKRTNPEFALSIETPCEIFIQDIDFALYRPYVGVPVYNYLYHEYALGDGGDYETGVCHPEQELIKIAKCLTDGISFAACIGKSEFDLAMEPLHPTMELLPNVCRAQRTYANEYLVLGQMLKPVEAEVNWVLTDRLYDVGPGGPKGASGQYKDNHIRVPCVMHSVWKSREGKIGYVLVNWTGSSQNVVLSLIRSEGRRHGRETLYYVSDTCRRELALEHPERVAVSVLARSVTLIEQG